VSVLRFQVYDIAKNAPTQRCANDTGIVAVRYGAESPGSPHQHPWYRLDDVSLVVGFETFDKCYSQHAQHIEDISVQSLPVQDSTISSRWRHSRYYQ